MFPRIIAFLVVLAELYNEKAAFIAALGAAADADAADIYFLLLIITFIFCPPIAHQHT
jgi:hypothetical protein